MILLLASALAADHVEQADSLAMGSTTTANPYALGGVTTNPAVIGLESRYIFGGGFSYGGRGIHWQAGAIDTLTSAAAFGLTYSGDRYNPPLTEDDLPGWAVPGQELTNLRRNHDVGLAIGAPLLDQKLVFGVGGSLSFFDHERSGKGTTGNVTAGVAWRPQPGLALGLTGRNLIPLDDMSERPLEVLAGSWVGEPGIAAFTVEGGVRPGSRKVLVLASGVEVNPSKATAVRAGWRLQDGVNHLSLGGGAGTTEGSIDLGVMVPTTHYDKPGDWTYMLSLRFLAPDINDVTPDG